MLAADAQPQHARRDAAERRHAIQHAQRQRGAVDLAASAFSSTARCTVRWIACTTRTGNIRRACTFASSGSGSRPVAIAAARMLAAATASWMARLIPTPPTGDMAWAASPIASSPGRCQRVRRSSETDSSFTSSHPRTAAMPGAIAGAARAISSRNAAMPRASTSAALPLRITRAHWK